MFQDCPLIFTLYFFRSSPSVISWAWGFLREDDDFFRHAIFQFLIFYTYTFQASIMFTLFFTSPSTSGFPFLTSADPAPNPNQSMTIQLCTRHITFLCTLLLLLYHPHDHPSSLYVTSTSPCGRSILHPLLSTHPLAFVFYSSPPYFISPSVCTLYQ